MQKELEKMVKDIKVIEGIPKTAFRTHEGQYEFLTMPFQPNKCMAAF